MPSEGDKTFGGDFPNVEQWEKESPEDESRPAYAPAVSFNNTSSGDHSHPEPCNAYYYDGEPGKDYEGGQRTGAATGGMVVVAVSTAVCEASKPARLSSLE